MPKRAARQEREPASLPDVTIPPSEAPESQRAAYWLQLIDDPGEFKRAVQTEDFWALLRDFPEAFWERLSLYLYRREDDSGVSLKNAEGKKKYIAIYRQPIDEEIVSRKCGGGKYTVYLKLDSKETLREFTFWLDGVPKALPGQVVEIEGRPVTVGAQAPTAPAPEGGSTIDKVIDANTRANESSMEIVTKASTTAIEMVREQAKAAANPPNQLTDLKTLLEIIRPQQPQGDAMTNALALMEKMENIYAKRNPAPIERPETPINETLETIKTLTGADSIAELLRPAARAAAADPVQSWAPIVGHIGSAFQSLMDKLPVILQQRNEAMRLEIHLRTMGATPKGQSPQLPEPTVIPPVQTAAAQPGPGTLDPQALVTALITTICVGFDKHRNTGSEIAASIDVQFGEQIEAVGIDRTLANEKELEAFIDGVPVLAERKKDARWPEFKNDFMAYTMERWGEPEGEEGAPEKKEPQPAA